MEICGAAGLSLKATKTKMCICFVLWPKILILQLRRVLFLFGFLFLSVLIPPSTSSSHHSSLPHDGEVKVENNQKLPPIRAR